MFVNHMLDFYDLLRGKQLLIFASYDVDSVSAFRIMQHLLKMDGIIHALVVVKNYTDLKVKYRDYAAHSKRILLINCGGGIDIMNFLENIPKDAIFFIMDNHRPFNLLNIYDHTLQVRILGFPDQEEYPGFDDVFFIHSDDEDVGSESEPSEDEDMFDDGYNERLAKRKSRRAVRARRKKRQAEFEKKRDGIVLKYTDHSYYGKPASMMALFVAFELSRATPEVVWWSIIGLTECLRLDKIDRSTYILLLSHLQDHVHRVKYTYDNSLFTLKIDTIEELDSYIYKHWNLYESMKYTPRWTCLFNAFTLKGEQKFKLFLAEAGLPLVDMKQQYLYMNYHIKRDVNNSIRGREVKYDLGEWTIPTFEAKYGHCFRFTALDVQMAALGMLDTSCHSSKTDAEKFFEAFCCLSKEGHKTIEHGISRVKDTILSIFNTVRFLTITREINIIGTLILASVPIKEYVVNDFNTTPGYLILLVRFLQKACVSTNQRRCKHLPFMLIAQLDNEYTLAIGVPPVSAGIHNIFGRVFEQVATKMKDKVYLDYFDTYICRLRSAYREDFIENVVAALAT